MPEIWEYGVDTFSELKDCLAEFDENCEFPFGRSSNPLACTLISRVMRVMKRLRHDIEENQGHGHFVQTLGGVVCWEFSGMYTGVLGLPTPLWSPRWERTT